MAAVILRRLFASEFQEFYTAVSRPYQFIVELVSAHRVHTYHFFAYDVFLSFSFALVSLFVSFSPPSTCTCSQRFACVRSRACVHCFCPFSRCAWMHGPSSVTSRIAKSVPPTNSSGRAAGRDTGVSTQNLRSGRRGIAKFNRRRWKQPMGRDIAIYVPVRQFAECRIARVGVAHLHRCAGHFR